jgi:hypothetical protein
MKKILLHNIPPKSLFFKGKTKNRCARKRYFSEVISKVIRKTAKMPFAKSCEG